MTGLPTLDPEIADLGIAIGLLDTSTTGVELNSDWFSNPVPHLTGVLADDVRRGALVRFADAMLAAGDHDEANGVSYLDVFDLREFAGTEAVPDLRIQVSVDPTPLTYVELGLVATLVTIDPATTTRATIPLYRAAKSGQTVAEPFALLAGSAVSVGTELVLDDSTPATDEFGLQGIAASVSAALTGVAAPTFSLLLKGLHLPGAATASDVQIGGRGASLEDALLSLVLGLVRRSVDDLTGTLADQVGAVLDLAGLGDAADIPPLPVDDLPAHGVNALRTWFTELMGAASARQAWISAIRQLLGGTASGNELDIPIGSGPVHATVTLNASTGAAGHLVITPRLGLRITTDVVGAVRLGVEANADLLTLDVETGAWTAVPTAEVMLTATGSGTGDAAKLLHNTVADVRVLRLGLEIRSGTPRALIQLLDAGPPGHTQTVIDLSTPDAAAAAAGHVASTLIRTALDALGAAGAELSGLLGLDPPTGVDPIDGAHLLADPLGTLADWWHTLVTGHAAAVPDVLTHLRNLVIGSDGLAAADAVSGTGTSADPWSIPVLTRLTIDSWLDGSTLVVAPTLSLRASDLAGGCTTVLTHLRVTLTSIDLAGPHATFPLAVDLSTRLRGTGTTEARLSLGPAAIVADYLGIAATWAPNTGLDVRFVAPNLTVDAGTQRIPLVLPTIDANGHVDLPADAWKSVENLVGVLADSQPPGWLPDLVALTGWSLVKGRRQLLSLAALVADPTTELKAWLTLIATDQSLLRSLTASLAHFFGGSTAGLSGAFGGSGTADDPWRAGLGRIDRSPQLTVWLGPNGPVVAGSQAPDVLQSWRPGMPGLSSAALAGALRDEATAGPDIADLAAGRADVETGLDALAGRWLGTDGLVAAPPASIPGLRIHSVPDATWRDLTGVWIEPLLAAPLPSDAVVVRVAVGAVADSPWTVEPGRMIDMTTPGVAPASFTVNAPATGEWVVALAPRADATLGGATDPTGLVGQSLRLQQVLNALAAAGPITLVAYGGAGHAARLAADAVSGVAHLVTVGTPWSAATFDTARTGVPADTLRLMHALLPALDNTDPDDQDLARGRALVDGFMDVARGRPSVADLEADRPATPIRGDLEAVAVFGTLPAATTARAITAVFAAGLSAPARDRAPAAAAPPDAAYLGVRIPFAFPTPPGGHGAVVSGSAQLTLGSIFGPTSTQPTPTVHATPSVRFDIDVADTDSWLVGGPGTTPVGGAPALELRRVRLSAQIGLHEQPSWARLVLVEGAAVGAEWSRLVVAPPDVATGSVDTLPLLPEARAVLAALTPRLASTQVGSPAALLTDLLRASGLTTPDGSLLPDGLDHLLHDPGAHIRAVPAGDLLAAVAALLPPMTTSGSAAQLDIGPLTVDVDVAARTVSLTASGDEGLIHWDAGLDLDAAGRVSFHAGLGDVTRDAFALTLASMPDLQVRLVRAGAAAVELWPALDVDGLGRFAAAAIPAEAVRVTLEALRVIDTGLGTALDDLASALGMLAPPDTDGVRAVRAPVRLFDDPLGWFSGAGVLSAVAGGPFAVAKVTDLLEAIKPFVGMAGTPRGSWPIADGLTVSVAPSVDGTTVSLAVDATAWLASSVPPRDPFAAGLTASIALASTGTPHPSADIFFGVPDQPDGTSSTQHRSCAHLTIAGSGLKLFLRPATGGDVELFPHPSGLGALLADGITQILPLVLNELAKLTGDATRTAIAELVGDVGRGLAVAAGTPAVFDHAALSALAADPGAYLRSHLGTLVTASAAALDPLLQQILDLPAGQHVATVSSTGALTVNVRTAVVEVHPAPLAVDVRVGVAGLPVIDAVTLSIGVDDAGLAGWSAGVGPAELDIGGPVVRPFLRGRQDRTSGWQLDLGLGLDSTSVTDVGHRELTARWGQSSGFGMLVTEVTSGGLDQTTDPVALATAAVDAVIDLVGGWVLGVDDVKSLLARPFGAGGAKTVGFVLEGSILDPTAAAGSPRLLPDVLSRWPAKLLTMAGQLATAAPSVPVGPFVLAVTDDGGVLGLGLSIAGTGGIDLSTGGDFTVTLEVDASWIDPPAPPGIVIRLLTVDGTGFDVTPGIAIDGVGVRLSKSTGPLIDAGLRLDSVAVHLFGSAQVATTGHAALAGGFEFELGGLAVPLGAGGGDNAVAKGIMRDAGGSGAPPRPAFSPSIAVQDHGTGVSVTLKAGTEPGPWFLPIQRAFGPVYIEAIGLGVDYYQGVTPRRLELINLYVDGQVSILGLTAAVDKLRLGYHVSRQLSDPSSWEVDVDGFAIASSVAGLTLAGALRKFPLDAPLEGVEYLGMLKVGYGSYGVDLFGGYAHPTTPSGSTFASFFAFGALHAPIGGAPAFFITGIAVGFGINRDLVTPDIDHVNTHPFMQALRALGPAPEPMQQLQQLRAIVPAAQGEYWVAAGVSFTSFVLVTGEVLVTVQFGAGLEIALLGLARVQLPNPLLPLVNIELALLARFSSTEGTLLVQAQLTENSYLLAPSVRLTGGFAFQTWWKGPNSGQLAVTIGGYHPRFHHDGYPVVPRVGINWSPIDNISIIGSGYFALCSEAIMAGLGIEATAHLGPAHAKLSFGGDAIIFFDPFWCQVDAYAEAEVGITIWLLFGSIDVDVHLGFDVTVEGPPIHVHGHFSVCGVGIPFEFGDKSVPADLALDGPDFAAKYLRGQANAQVVQAAVMRGAITAGKSSAAGSGGVDKVPDGSAEHPFRVVPEFLLTFVSTVPVETMTLSGGAGTPKTTTVSAPGLGVAPMYSASLQTSLTLTFVSVDGQPFDFAGVALTPRAAAAFPKGVWGPAGNPAAKVVPAGDVIDAADGLTIDTVIPDSRFTGAPPIDYHQIELPLTGRKPLPFVTNTSQTDGRVIAAAALKTAAEVFSVGDLDDDLRFSRAARVLSAGGRGLTTVAAMRGERSAPPTFGSLADDLVDAPAAVSPTVTGMVVGHDPVPPVRFAPIVKAVLGTPLSLALDRPSPTTVKDPADAIARGAPTLASVRTKQLGTTQAVLTVLPRSGQDNQQTVLPVGAAPLTRLGSQPVGAVANAAPTPDVAARLEAMAAALNVTDEPTPGEPAGAVVHEGEVAVVTVAQRPASGRPDQLIVTGGATRVMAIGAGGRALDDRIVGAVSGQATVELPQATERVVIVGIGDSKATDGTVAGWVGGQSLPGVGWGSAISGGALVSAQATRVPGNRQRGDGGWVSTSALAAAGRVVTAFTDPVDVVAVAIDDYLGADAASAVDIRLLDAERFTDASGTPLPPQALVDGVRTILLYAVRTTGPEPAVVVDGCTGGELAGVLGSAGPLADLAAHLAASGIEAAVQPALVGGPGSRQIRYVMADGPIDPAPTATKKAAVKKAAVKKAAVKKAAVKKAAVKKTRRRGGSR